MSRYMTFDQACEYLNMPASTLYKHTRLGRVPHVKRTGGSRCMFRADWFDLWDEGCELISEPTPSGGRIVRPKRGRHAS